MEVGNSGLVTGVCTWPVKRLYKESALISVVCTFSEYNWSLPDGSVIYRLVFSNNGLFHYYVTRTESAGLDTHKLNSTDCTLMAVSTFCRVFLFVQFRIGTFGQFSLDVALPVGSSWNSFILVAFWVWPSRVSFLPHVLSVCSSL